jgi:ferredoxin-NADP reductase
MGNHKAKILSIEYITRDVLQVCTERPSGLGFKPGQAVDISLNREGWQHKKRSFTFTSLPDEQYLQFIIKTYQSRRGVTSELLNMKKGDELILHEVFGTIEYKGEGYFIAGGAGITPFISIFRDLKLRNATGNNKLIFANKTRDDIILKYEFEHMLGKNFINILSDEMSDDYAHGFIAEDFLKEQITDIHKYFYICGPYPMMKAVEQILSGLGVDEKLIIKERF